ncbi:agmatine deiminase family protein [Alteromonas flava]|uniref:agmatine deiminase family protein n=1 Tax=Alteromonas flava TaxID=2048003 RepID=UPI000C28960A|nr:agmatine deiminase family protein [Alteromonas flava]
MTATLIPEWEPCEAVILAWPNENTDWAPWLPVVTNTYKQLIAAINAAGAGVILLCRNQDIASLSTQLANARVLLIAAEYNDTWVRDYAFLTLSDTQGQRLPVEFEFNGWGNKFSAQRDNVVNRKFLAELCQHALATVDVVCEGGALEIDQDGHLLSTALCLSNPERNGEMPLQQYEMLFADALGAKRTTILEHGHLEGDDTDGHIDTLVRFTPDNGIVIQSAYNRPEDSHFAGLSELVKEVRMHFPAHEIFELPLPEIINTEGERLPASYANFLICNSHVLCPVYDQVEDEMALEVMRKAYPDHQIVAVNCHALVQQFGSLHCITMQVPRNTFKPAVIQQLNKGVSSYVS